MSSEVCLESIDFGASFLVGEAPDPNVSRSVPSPVGYQNQGVSLESSDFFAAAFLGYVFVYDV